jgi:hypothetical protein
MENIATKIASVDWQNITCDMHKKGFTIIPNVMTSKQCGELKDNYDNPNGYRKTVVMERFRFGLGEYKYFDYPLPALIQTIRETFYPRLVPIANTWMKQLNIDKLFPETFQEMQTLCQQNNQLKTTVLILKYGRSGHNTLHQDLYGDVYFPIQAVLFLTEPDEDYTGGEFVLT